MRAYTPFEQKMADISDTLHLRGHRRWSPMFADLAYGHRRLASWSLYYALLPRFIYNYLSEREGRRLKAKFEKEYAARLSTPINVFDALYGPDNGHKKWWNG